MIGSEILCVIIPWVLAPVIGFAIGRRKCVAHVVARRAYGRFCLAVTLLCYGGIVAAFVVIQVVQGVAGRELPRLQAVFLLSVLFAPGFAVILATYVAERFPISRYTSFCSTCGYPLRGDGSRCSECGSPPATDL